MKTDQKIFIAGHRGLVGSALVRKYQRLGYQNLVVRTRQELDLCNQGQVQQFFESENIEQVIMAAAHVGGIMANQSHQADFLYENLIMAANVIQAAATHGVDKLLFLGSSCIYPKFATQPISENSLLTGALEPTNEGYAIAKIAGLKLCEKYHSQYGKCFISAMPTNLYGPGDNFHPINSHVIPGMMRRFHEAKMQSAKSVTLWGSGSALREFLHVDDLADAIFLLMQTYNESQTINVGTGEDQSIKELATIMKQVVGFEGDLNWDTSKPDGTPKKVLNVDKIHSLGWRHSVALKDGLTQTYAWALKEQRL